LGLVAGLLRPRLSF